MSATFVTDILTVIGLSILFITPNIWIIPFTAVSVLLMWASRESHRGSSPATATA